MCMTAVPVCKASENSWLSCSGWSSTLPMETERLRSSDVVCWLLSSCQPTTTHWILYMIVYSNVFWPGNVNWLHVRHARCKSFLLLNSFVSVNLLHQAFKGTVWGPDRQSDLAGVGRDVGCRLDAAGFWTETQGGVQAEEGGKGPLVGQGDDPWNSLAHHVRTEVKELAVDLQLQRACNDHQQKAAAKQSYSVGSSVRQRWKMIIIHILFINHHGYSNLKLHLIGPTQSMLYRVVIRH